MTHNRKHINYIVVFVCLFTILASLMFLPPTYGLNIPAGTTFPLTGYGTSVSFLYAATADNYTVTNTTFTAYNFTMLSIQTSSFAVSVTAANITVSYIDLNERITYTVADVGSQNWYINKRPSQVTINGAGTNSYTYADGWLNITSAPAGSTVQANFYDTSDSLPTDFYFLSYTQTVLNTTGYAVSSQPGWTSGSAQQTFSGVGTVQYGFRAWLLHSDDTPATNIVGADDPAAILTRSTSGEGMQNSTVAVQGKQLVLGMNAIKVVLYVRFEGGDWLTMATFISNLLVEKAIVAGTWSFNLYTKVSNTTDTTAYAYWGDQAKLSGIGGVSFTHPLPQEKAISNGMQGNFIGMILFPFTYVVGDIFYAFVLLFVGGNLYLRHKRFEIIVIMLVLWGSTSGIGLLIPGEAFRVLYIILLLAIAVILYRLLR